MLKSQSTLKLGTAHNKLTSKHKAGAFSLAQTKKPMIKHSN